MAKRQASGKLKSLEERLGQLGFMRRAREKLRLEESAKEKAFKGKEVSWLELYLPSPDRWCAAFG